MNEETKTVNYELAYRLLVLLCAATIERDAGTQVDLGKAHTILGVSQDELTDVFDALRRDGIVNEFQNGEVVVG